MVGLEEFAFHGEGLAVEVFGFGPLAALDEHDGQVVEGHGDPLMFVTEEFAAHGQSLALEVFGLDELVPGVEDGGEVAEGGSDLDVIGAEDSAAEGEGFALECFGFGEFPLPLENEGQIFQRPGDFGIVAGEAAFPQSQGFPVHGLSLRVAPQGPVNLAKGPAEVGFDFGLIFEFFADAFGGFVEDFAEEGGVAAQGDGGADAFEHFHQEIGGVAAPSRSGTGPGFRAMGASEAQEGC
jgi:hypothetical protein